MLLVLDATTGQNGLAQAKVFLEAVEVSGVVLTKLDGTAKGGIVVAIQRELGLPGQAGRPGRGRRRPGRLRPRGLRRRPVLSRSRPPLTGPGDAGPHRTHRSGSRPVA